MAEKYQGFASRETWTIALWIDSVEATQRHWYETAESFKAGTPDREDATFLLAQVLEQEYEHHIDGLNLTGFVADLLNASLERVDWRDLAEHLLSD